MSNETFKEILHNLEEAHTRELQNLIFEIECLRRQTSTASSFLGAALRPEVPEKPSVARESTNASIEAQHEVSRFGGDSWPSNNCIIEEVLSPTATHRPSLIRAQSTDTCYVDQSYREAALRTSSLMTAQKSEVVDMALEREITKSDRTSSFHRGTSAIVESVYFEVVFAIAILTNSIFLGVRVDMQDDEPPFMQVLEYAYTALFTVELILRVRVIGFRAFILPKMMLWFYLDLFVVVSSLLEIAVELVVSSDDGARSSDLASMSNVRMFRVLRVIRIVKVIRVARLLRFIRALRKLVLSIAHTLRTVMWACLLLIMIIYVFALTIVQAVHAHTDLNKPEIKDLTYYWGSLPRSMLTLYMTISDGISWIIVAEPLTAVSGWLLLTFILYISFTIFAVLNVITGVFCEAALESARQDYELMIQTHLEEKDTFTEAVYAAFGVEKQSGEDLQLSYKEFEQVFNNPNTSAYLAALELNSSDAWELFKLLDTDASAIIDVDEFVNGCLRLKGMAKAIDIAKLSYEQKIRQKRLHRFMTDVERKLDAMHITQAECLHARSRSL